MKYIIILWKGREKPIIFSRSLKHELVAAGIPVVAAGFVILRGRKVYCTGPSGSLNLESRPEKDAQVIEAEL